MFSKFSEEAQKVLVNSKKEMKSLKHSYVGSEHLVLSMLKLNDEFSSKLKEYGVTYNKFRDKLIETVGYGDIDNNWFLYTPLLKRIIETSLLVSKEASMGLVTVEHLIYSLFDEDDGIGIRILNKLGVDIAEIQSYYSCVISNKKKNSKKKLLVEEFGIDLTKKASLGELDPVVGRDEEIKRIIEILCRRSKNNPLLIGDAGVGKTALVEELARLIVSGKVPNKLKNKRIISVSIAALVSGTKYRGEFEERLTKVLKELSDDSNILLFIDEIHTIMGAGGAEGAIDAANIFKPALARGDIRLIGATTTSEYRQTIEKDKAMERRFQTVFVLEPDKEKVFNILKTLKPLYENYHNVRINDEIINKIIDLSNTYIHDRYQPDKSIDILDEVCSKVSLDYSNIPTKLDNYKQELLEVRNSKNKYLLDQDYINAAKIKNIEKELTTKINNIELRKNVNKNCREVKLCDVLSIVSRKSNVPIYEIDVVNKKYFSNLEKVLNEKVIGQSMVKKELINITKRMKFGYKNNNRPFSMLFVGPTGVGKTLLALTYADYLFGKNKIIKLDGSEFKDISSLNKFLGSAPGYVGYNDGKNKLEEIKNNPHTLILFDEIEKAHPAVLNLFLQILDDGKITDNNGDVIYFNNHIIIMTSNLGYNIENIGFTLDSNKEDSKVKDFLSVELLNRINKVIYFNKMQYEDIYKIVKMRLFDIKSYFKEKNIKIHLGNKIVDKVITLSRYNEFGARKIETILEDIIDNKIIDTILDGKKEIYINA